MGLELKRKPDENIQNSNPNSQIQQRINWYCKTLLPVDKVPTKEHKSQTILLLPPLELFFSRIPHSEMATTAISCFALPSKFRNLSLNASSSCIPVSPSSSTFRTLTFSSNISVSAFSSGEFLWVSSPPPPPPTPLYYLCCRKATKLFEEVSNC